MYKAYTRRNVGKTKRHEEGGDSTDLRLWRTRRQTTQGRRRGGDRSSSLAPSGRSTRAKNSVEPAGRRPCCDAPSTPQSYGSRLPRRAMADHTRTRASRSTNYGRCLRDNWPHEACSRGWNPLQSPHRVEPIIITTQGGTHHNHPQGGTHHNHPQGGTRHNHHFNLQWAFSLQWVVAWTGPSACTNQFVPVRWEERATLHRPEREEVCSVPVPCLCPRFFESLPTEDRPVYERRLLPPGLVSLNRGRTNLGWMRWGKGRRELPGGPLRPIGTHVAAPLGSRITLII